MAAVKVVLTGMNQVSERTLIYIAGEALKEVTLSDMKWGAANGETVYVRVENTSYGLEWFKAYVYKIGDQSLYIDAQPVTDEEVMRRGRPMPKVQGS